MKMEWQFYWWSLSSFLIAIAFIFISEPKGWYGGHWNWGTLIFFIIGIVILLLLGGIKMDEWEHKGKYMFALDKNPEGDSK